MNGPGNFREAALILVSDPCSYSCPHAGCAHEMAMIARAQVHATLALTAATLGRGSLTLADRHEWQMAIDPQYAAEQAAEHTWHGNCAIGAPCRGSL